MNLPNVTNDLVLRRFTRQHHSIYAAIHIEDQASQTPDTDTSRYALAHPRTRNA
jgi:hypothetical protein